MPLTHTKELFAKALKGKYAVGAFNVNNMELLQAIVEACEEEKAPSILQISKGARQYANGVYLKKLIEAAVSTSNIPLAVHLDHGDSFELCTAATKPSPKMSRFAGASSNTRTPATAWWKASWACWWARSTTRGRKAAAIPRAALTPTRTKRWNSCARPGWIRWRWPSATRTARINSKARNTLIWSD